MADFTYEQQDDVLAMCLSIRRGCLARTTCASSTSGGSTIRPHIALRSTRKLLDAARKAKKDGIVLMVENEFACNTATGAEAAKLMAEVPAPLMMLWDAANAAMDGEHAFPDGYNLLPKHRIAHCHCKDVVKNPTGSAADWAAVGTGSIDWAGQFRALKSDGYSRAVSLETHWRGAGSPEASTRVSWAGEKAALIAADALTA
jgi:sugar phosphate isomerase/epimerase